MNEVVTQIEGGLLVQLDGTVTDQNGEPVKAKEAEAIQAEAKEQAEAAKIATETKAAPVAVAEPVKATRTRR